MCCPAWTSRRWRIASRGFALDQLRGVLADRLGGHELPAAPEFREAPPRSAAGRLLAARLRAEVKGTA